MNERTRARLAALLDESGAVALLLMDIEAAWDALPADVRLRCEQHAAAQELNGRLEFDGGRE